jgi:hypothetical protein
LACFATPADDPYITMRDADSDDEDRDDFELKADDNLILVAQCDKVESFCK